MLFLTFYRYKDNTAWFPTNYNILIISFVKQENVFVGFKSLLSVE